jgi:hypothetical protein
VRASRLRTAVSVGELVAAVAVVLSVIFVGIEIRQNSEAQMRVATQAAVSDYIGSLERITESRDIACLYVRGAQDFGALSGSERLRFSAFYMSFYYQLQQMHRLAEEGSLDPETWAGFEGLLRETTRYPGVRQWFEVRREWFGPGFQAYIDGLMRTSPAIEDYVFADAVDPACT